MLCMVYLLYSTLQPSEEDTFSWWGSRGVSNSPKSSSSAQWTCVWLQAVSPKFILLSTIFGSHAIMHYYNLLSESNTTYQFSSATFNDAWPVLGRGDRKIRRVIIAPATIRHSLVAFLLIRTSFQNNQRYSRYRYSCHKSLWLSYRRACDWPKDKMVQKCFCFFA